MLYQPLIIKQGNSTEILRIFHEKGELPLDGVKYYPEFPQ